MKAEDLKRVLFFIWKTVNFWEGRAFLYKFLVPVYGIREESIGEILTFSLVREVSFPCFKSWKRRIISWRQGHGDQSCFFPPDSVFHFLLESPIVIGFETRQPGPRFWEGPGHHWISILVYFSVKSIKNHKLRGHSRLVPLSEMLLLVFLIYITLVLAASRFIIIKIFIKNIFALIIYFLKINKFQS